MVFSIHCFASGDVKMSGTYTIGDKPRTDFKTVAEAERALEIIGANGPVVFVMDKDQYNAKEIANANAHYASTGNVAFKSADNQQNIEPNGPATCAAK